MKGISQVAQSLRALQRAFIVLVWMSIAWSFAAQAQDAGDELLKQEIDRLSESAVTDIEKGEHDKATTTLRQLLDLDSMNVFGWYAMGIVHQREHRHDSAIICMARAMNIGGIQSDIQIAMANSFYELRSWRDAEMALAGNVRGGDATVEAVILMTKVYAQTNRDSLVAPMLQRAERMAEKTDDLLEVARAHSWHGRHEHAARLLTTIAASDTSMGHLVLDAFREQSRAGMHREAMRTLDACEQRFGTQTLLRCARVATALDLGDSTSAANYRRLAALEDDSPFFDAARVRGLMVARRYYEALVICYQALHAKPGIAAAHMLASNINLMLSRPLQACAELGSVPEADSSLVLRIAEEVDWPGHPRAACVVWEQWLSRRDESFSKPGEREDYTDPASGLVFGSILPGALRMDMSKAESEERGLMVGYDLYDDSEKYGNMTFYVYPAPLRTRGPWFMLNDKGERFMDTTGLPGRLLQMTDPSPALLAEFWRARRDIVQFRPGAVPKGEIRFIVSESRQIAAQYAWYTINHQGQDQYSALYVFAINGHFVKVRATLSRGSSLPDMHVTDIIQRVVGELEQNGD